MPLSRLVVDEMHPATTRPTRDGTQPGDILNDSVPDKL